MVTVVVRVRAVRPYASSISSNRSAIPATKRRNAERQIRLLHAKLQHARRLPPGDALPDHTLGRPALPRSANAAHPGGQRALHWPWHAEIEDRRSRPPVHPRIHQQWPHITWCRRQCGGGDDFQADHRNPPT
ncbi:hypothetical protein [Fodinicola feengrottensis]|uniref:hypothetical protein n=1 Tax=Fodinicola feengrottensis TaxID=435914 RepID=UPI0013D2DAFD|nr:hypothetical protein [Fodinicola feengrottensis]